MGGKNGKYGHLIPFSCGTAGKSKTAKNSAKVGMLNANSTRRTKQAQTPAQPNLSRESRPKFAFSFRKEKKRGGSRNEKG